tara:strand:- start:290 stop:871 length:582 start_codon:yes stop_codon:yes gene_type:complete
MNRLNQNLINKLLFYESYHSNKLNKLIHVIFVPLIFYSALVMTSYISLYIPVIGSLAYMIYYIYLDRLAGITYSLLLLFMLSHINTISFYTALFVHILSWIAQILSHKFVEKRAPALLDSFFQAITIAPLFTWYEVLSIFGYRRRLLAYIHCEALYLQRFGKLRRQRSFDEITFEEETREQKQEKTMKFDFYK